MRPGCQGLRIRDLNFSPSQGFRPQATSWPSAIAFHWLWRSQNTMKNATGSAETARRPLHRVDYDAWDDLISHLRVRPPHAEGTR
jgi:hypothetical protein